MQKNCNLPLHLQPTAACGGYVLFENGFLFRVDEGKIAMLFRIRFLTSALAQIKNRIRKIIATFITR